jgi:hypothetical protein
MDLTMPLLLTISQLPNLKHFHLTAGRWCAYQRPFTCVLEYDHFPHPYYPVQVESLSFDLRNLSGHVGTRPFIRSFFTPRLRHLTIRSLSLFLDAMGDVFFLRTAKFGPEVLLNSLSLYEQRELASLRSYLRRTNTSALSKIMLGRLFMTSLDGQGNVELAKAGEFAVPTLKEIGCEFNNLPLFHGAQPISLYCSTFGQGKDDDVADRVMGIRFAEPVMEPFEVLKGMIGFLQELTIPWSPEIWKSLTFTFRFLRKLVFVFSSQAISNITGAERLSIDQQVRTH